MADVKGTKNSDSLEGTSSWFIVDQAECIDSLDSLEELFEESTNESIVSNLIDDGEILEQGNSLALYNAQAAVECDTAIAALKRKYTKSPEQAVAELSPQLQAVKISSQRNSKRRLFQDSGVVEDEAENSFTQVESTENTRQCINDKTVNNLLNVLKSTNSKAVLYNKFKDIYGISYVELVRSFKSDKSCNPNWVVVVFYAVDEVIEASKILLQKHCSYIQLKQLAYITQYLVQFNSSKSRETVLALFSSMLNIDKMQMLADPPKIRSVPVAVSFYKNTLSGNVYSFGELPSWIAQQTLLTHELPALTETFELSKMVQWAYDNDFTDDCDIAYNYASIASEDPNASAFLKSNNQVKHVRDCSIMVKMYKRKEMKDMTMAQWIYKCCDNCNEEDDWKSIAHFLKYQHINILSFLIALKLFFRCTPKKSCIVIWGPPDTGKSHFCFSLIRFLKGNVVSFINRSSHFWLQPLRDCKIGFMDDASYLCWSYLEQNMRNAFDGNYFCVDAKHKAPMQLKLPPMFITTNVNVMGEVTLKYLHSRLQCFEFPNALPFDNDGTPLYKFTDGAWKSFFRKLGAQLDLKQPEADENGVPGRPFRCTAGTDSETY
ncbi:E1 [Human papillomavirus type 183]|nr:E1 [Human papillomavirus type 183]